jgi:hypothetical protein
MTRARIPIMADYRKIDDFTFALSTKRPASYFPYMAVYILFTSPAPWLSSDMRASMHQAALARAPDGPSAVAAVALGNKITHGRGHDGARRALEGAEVAGGKAVGSTLGIGEGIPT